MSKIYEKTQSENVRRSIEQHQYNKHNALATYQDTVCVFYYLESRETMYLDSVDEGSAQQKTSA